MAGTGSKASDGFVFLLIARLLWDKGVQEFVDAARAIKATEPKAMGPEKRLFAFSIFYLFGLFAALVVDRWVV